MTVRENVAFGLRIRKRPEGARSTRGRRAARARAARRATGTATRRSSPAASASAWRSPARWPSSRRCCCSTSPSARSTRKVRAELRAWLRRLHDEVHVTTVLVTHDQEEAMEVADRIAVINEGRIEQVGAPRELYERPANGFVMGFLGPGRPPRRGPRAPARPALTAEPATAPLEAMVERVVHLGFEVRVELTDGAPLAVSSPATRPSRWSSRRATSSGSANRAPAPSRWPPSGLPRRVRDVARRLLRHRGRDRGGGATLRSGAGGRCRNVA